MPIYEFECRKCHREFEELVMGSHPEIQCPQCESTEVKRLLSVTAFKTDSPSGNPGPSSGGGCGGCHSHSCGSCH